MVGCFGLLLRKNEIQPAGRTKSMLRMVEILSSFGLNLQALPANDEAPKPFRFRGFIYPGSYLLSRDLSSDYHRRADVSLPGSEWDRVGPSGYDHQVSGSFSLLCSLLTSVIICACGLLWCFCWLPLWQQADIRVAYGFCVFLCFSLSLRYTCFKQNCLSPGCLYKVCWMLVVLGSIHYCNYTCTLSTWSSSTLL